MNPRKTEIAKMLRKAFLQALFAAVSVFFLFPAAAADDLDDDEFLIELPPRENEANSSSQKQGNASKNVRYEDKLQGVFYDLKQLRNRQPNPVFKDVPTSGWSDARIAPTLKIIRSFVNGSWRREYDSQGLLHFPELDAYYCSPTRLWNSCFYSAKIPSEDVLPLFQCKDEVKPYAWCCIYSGYVRVPVSGKFRFVGFCDDLLVVRFNQQIALDYGCYSSTLGVGMDAEKRGELSVGTQKQYDRQMRMTNDNPLYSKFKLETCFPDLCDEHGLGKGPVFTVKAGEAIPIDILIGDIGGNFSFALFLEQLDANGNPQTRNPERFPLFRTTSDLPEPAQDGVIPGFEPTGPIWSVVDRFNKPVLAHSATKRTASGSEKRPQQESAVRTGAARSDLLKTMDPAKKKTESASSTTQTKPAAGRSLSGSNLGSPSTRD